MDRRSLSFVGSFILLFAFARCADVSSSLANTNSVFVKAIDVTGLNRVLNNPSQSFTLFVPTNDAFSKLASNLGISEGELYNEPHLAAILLYHIVPGQYLASDLKDGMTLQTAIPDWKLKVDLSQPGLAKVASYNSEANVVASDIKTDNSVVHNVDVVLLPPNMENQEIARNSIGF